MLSDLKKDCIFILLLYFQALCHKMSEGKKKRMLSYKLKKASFPMDFFLQQKKVQKRIVHNYGTKKEKNCHITRSIPSYSVQTFMESMLQNKCT